jgi:hypothetical protein
MPHGEVICLKCKARMQEGFIVDNTYGGRLVTKWIEGAPEKSRWLGVRLRDKKAIEVATYRCTSCGYLESYAK